jgi:hypothetical protein
MCILIIFIFDTTNDKWWPQCQVGASKTKTVGYIPAIAFLWIQHMEYDQYSPALPFDMLLVTIHVLFHSFSLLTSLMANGGLSVNYCTWRNEEKNSGHHSSKSFFVTWAHEVWPIETCYTFLHTPGNHTCASSFIWFFTWPITNDGLSVNWEQARGKQWWAWEEEHMEYYQYRSTLPFDMLLVTIQVLLHSF